MSHTTSPSHLAVDLSALTVTQHPDTDVPMASVQSDIYARSCNPSRRAKRVRSDPHPDGTNTHSPSPSISMSVSMRRDDSATPTPAIVHAKRGRKPGTLSRAARDTQRKLNHSIIEKARRTKINDALATLRQLVPDNYGPSKKQEYDDEDDHVDDDEDGSKKAKTKGKGSGKREEKEKEFKLEILIRTVSFMQDLLTKVASFEEGVRCTKCGSNIKETDVASTGMKRKRDFDDDDRDVLESEPMSSRNRESYHSVEKDQETMATSCLHAEQLLTSPRLLPSISSWLPNSHIDPSLLPNESAEPRTLITQLPSPPTSTHFYPISNTGALVPPALNLGPVAIPQTIKPPARTPEDESAASLLLQISSSSPSSSRSVLSSSSSASSSSLASPIQSASRSSLIYSMQFPETHPKPQTPSSILGLGLSARTRRL